MRKGELLGLGAYSVTAYSGWATNFGSDGSDTQRGKLHCGGGPTAWGPTLWGPTLGRPPISDLTLKIQVWEATARGPTVWGPTLWGPTVGGPPLSDLKLHIPSVPGYSVGDYIMGAYRLGAYSGWATDFRSETSHAQKKRYTEPYSKAV